MLSLSLSVSKRRMQADGYTVSQFEGRYREALGGRGGGRGANIAR